MMIAIIITQAFQLLPLPEIHLSMELRLTRLKDAKEYKQKRNENENDYGDMHGSSVTIFVNSNRNS